MNVVSTLQTVCVLLIAIEYYGQISKLVKKKRVGSISWVYWLTKILITVLQVITLMLANTALDAYISQVMSLMLCLTVFGLMIHYHHHENEEEDENKYI